MYAYFHATLVAGSVRISVAVLRQGHYHGPDHGDETSRLRRVFTTRPRPTSRVPAAATPFWRRGCAEPRGLPAQDAGARPSAVRQRHAGSRRSPLADGERHGSAIDVRSIAQD